jgi:hypothetical protein
VVAKGPAFADRHIAGRGGRLTLPPRTMRRKTDWGIADAAGGAATLAGGVGVGRGADRNSPSGMRSGCFRCGEDLTMRCARDAVV